MGEIRHATRPGCGLHQQALVIKVQILDTMVRIVKLVVKAEPIIILYVMDCPTPHSTILGRNWLPKMKAVKVGSDRMRLGNLESSRKSEKLGKRKEERETERGGVITHKLSFAEMTNPARLLFQNSGRVLDFSLLLLSNSPSLADGFWCLANSDCLRSLPLALPSLSLSPSSNPHPPSLTYALHCPHFKSCSECTHEFNLHRPVIDEATEFFKTVGVSDFTFDSCKLVLYLTFFSP
ncbi:hypothetical protein ACFX11_018898 [Malus domestica]